MERRMGSYITFWRGKVHLDTYTDSVLCIFLNLQIKEKMTKIILQVYYCFQVQKGMAQADISFDRVSS